jgi:hypothetical protein
MNRFLVIPGCVCGLAFGALVAAFQLVGVPASAGPANTQALTAKIEPADRLEPELPPNVDAQQLLTAITSEYLRPWNQWNHSRENLYSRAAPRPVSPIESKIELAPPLAGSERDSRCLLATITLTSEGKSQVVPCVVDRDHADAWFFTEGKWLAKEDWLKQAPHPRRGFGVAPAGR